MNKKITLLAVVIVILVIAAAFWLHAFTSSTPTVSEQTTSPSASSSTENWNTYTDSQYGFSIKLPPDYKFIGQMTPNAQGEFVLTPANQKFNDSITSPSGAYLAMQVTTFNQQPATGQMACDKAAAGNGQAYDENGNPLPPPTCNPTDMISQNSLSTFAQSLANTPTSQSITLPNFLIGIASTGTVIALDGNKAILVLARNTQAVGSTANLYWFDKTSDLIDIYQELDAPTAAIAVQSQQYTTFLSAISSLKFQ